jgi:hypothetical protein
MFVLTCLTETAQRAFRGFAAQFDPVADILIWHRPCCSA